MLAEETAVPPAHLVIRGFFHVLDFLGEEQGDGFAVEVMVYPRGDFPVLFGDLVCGWNWLERWYSKISAVHTVVSFCFCCCSCSPLELFSEGHVVEECPWVVEFTVPRSFQIVHAQQYAIEFFIAH